MSYNCRIYESTGFNAGNIPYDFATIERVTTSNHKHDVSELEIRQQRFLTSIRVKISWVDVNNADYVALYKGTISNITSGSLWCYFVTNVVMVAEDTAELTLMPDFITSSGGIPALTIIDGITRRSTSALFLDVTELPTDPYLAPARPMTIVSDWITFGTSTNTFITSTLDLDYMGDVASNKAIDATSAGAEKVTYPIPVAAGDYADSYGKVSYEVDNTTITYEGIMTFILDGTLSPVTNTDSVRTGISKARGMGVESAILAQWCVPVGLVTYTRWQLEGSPTAVITVLHGKNSGDNGVSALSTTNVKRELVEMNYLAHNTLNTKIKGIINNSDYMPLTMTSCSGESVTSDVKDLKDSNDTFAIDWLADPRPDGKMYFRFKYLNTTAEEIGTGKWFRNCISSLPWKQVPLVYTEASGSSINTVKFNAQQNQLTAGYRGASTMNTVARSNNNLLTGTQQGNIDAQAIVDVASGGVEASSGALMMALAPTVGGVVGKAGGRALTQFNTVKSMGLSGASSAGSGLGGIVQGIVNKDLQTQMNQANFNATNASLLAQQGALDLNYNAQKLSDQLAYGIQQDVVVPTVMFPYNTETLRDFYGNGILVTRPKYDTEDAKRIARIIAAFGIAYTQEANISHFTPRQDMGYCFVDATITIADKPQWLANAINVQLAGGVRIWNTKPYHIVLEETP